jgi:thiol-disulfide isomerase/thioredoxin
VRPVFASMIAAAALTVAVAGCGAGDQRGFSGAADRSPIGRPPAPLRAPRVTHTAPVCPQLSGSSPVLTTLASVPCLATAGEKRVDVGRRPLLVNLWASWCVPCQREMPLLQSFSRADRAVAVIGVDSDDTRGSGSAFLGAIHATYPEVFDAHGALRQSLHAVGLPVTIAIGTDGAIRQVHVGQVNQRSLTALAEAAS